MEKRTGAPSLRQKAAPPVRCVDACERGTLRVRGGAHPTVCFSGAACGNRVRPATSVTAAVGFPPGSLRLHSSGVDGRRRLCFAISVCSGLVPRIAPLTTADRRQPAQVAMVELRTPGRWERHREARAAPRPGFAPAPLQVVRGGSPAVHPPVRSPPELPLGALQPGAHRRARDAERERDRSDCRERGRKPARRQARPRAGSPPNPPPAASPAVAHSRRSPLRWFAANPQTAYDEARREGHGSARRSRPPPSPSDHRRQRYRDRHRRHDRPKPQPYSLLAHAPHGR